MNQDRIEGHWKQFKGKVKERRRGRRRQEPVRRMAS
jgi:hypothetical protein